MEIEITQHRKYLKQQTFIDSEKRQPGSAGSSFLHATLIAPLAIGCSCLPFYLMQYDPLICTGIQVAWIVIAGIFFVKRHDELPLIVSTFVLYIFSFRFWALAWGWTTGVDLLPFGFTMITYESATTSL